MREKQTQIQVQTHVKDTHTYTDKESVWLPTSTNDKKICDDTTAVLPPSETKSDKR
eukprot:m.208528 g.208528  ORF g.208528 m.208528 type:complete len:56 (+) comp33009_c1_seq1:1971-2138(+)